MSEAIIIYYNPLLLPAISWKRRWVNKWDIFIKLRTPSLSDIKSVKEGGDDFYSRLTP